MTPPSLLPILDPDHYDPDYWAQRDSSEPWLEEEAHWPVEGWLESEPDAWKRESLSESHTTGARR